MLKEGLSGETDEVKAGVGMKMLLMQGIATSIDALSVGFTIADYGFLKAFVCAFLIAGVTYAICMAGLKIGKKFGIKFQEKLPSLAVSF